MNCEECGKSITGRGKSNYCQRCFMRIVKPGKKGGGWSKGLTKDTDDRIKKMSIKVSAALKGKPKTEKHATKLSKIFRKKYAGKGNPFYGKKHSDDTKKILSEKAIHRSKKINPIFNILNNISNSDTSIEVTVENFLQSEKIEYKKQYRIYYNKINFKIYDFYLLKENILIEVDGDFWHCKLEKKPKNYKDIIVNDKLKNDLATENGYRLVRISQSELDSVWRIIV
jgi:very-short-patch-repair endonuclease